MPSTSILAETFGNMATLCATHSAAITAVDYHRTPNGRQKVALGNAACL
jgi:hypothetical protein